MKIILTSIILLITTICIAQDTQYIKPGIYNGELEENNTTIKYSLKFDSDGYAYQLDSNGNKKSFKFKQTSSYNQITTLEWINSSEYGSWTETQLFIITKLSNDVILVCHLRYVVNKGKEKESWGYIGKGIFYLEN